MDIQYHAPGARKGNRFWVITGRDFVPGYADKQKFELSTGEVDKEAAERATPSKLAGWRQAKITQAQLAQAHPAPVVVDHNFQAAADLYLDSRPGDKPFTANYRSIVKRLCQ